MTIAAVVVVAELAVLIAYRIIWRNRDGLPASLLNAYPMNYLAVAAVACLAGWGTAGRLEVGWSDVATGLFLGGLLPAQAAYALRLLTPKRTHWLPWLVVCVGGLAVGSRNQSALWPWS
ncbi:hypothetical protein AB0C51_17930 [Streptomyces pathocidini]|uniref:hypothetical protein n=1 Tax=Streptomyces pathocidini TaxID=1650571 RepID=UPI00340A2F21